ncbi:type 1 fimbrial protein [Vibrio sp. SCSIO 43140]|nr:type 1 fimbrial protein [Vibrio sp. SCSIO 43140]
MLSSSAFSAFPAAAPNVLFFQGEVTDETCTVSINGDEANPIILLPRVPKSELAASGDVAGAIDFDVSISGCTGDAVNPTGINTVFVGNQVTTNGNLGNIGSATNVELQIVDTTGTKINFNNNNGFFVGTNDLGLAVSETQKTATYKVQYYATGAATPGTVDGSLQYAISYQ